MTTCSQEVVWRSSVDVSELILPWCWVELEESVLHELVDLHYGGLVAATVAVVWCREDGYHVAVVGPVVTIHYELMSASYQFKVV